MGSSLKLSFPTASFNMSRVKLLILLRGFSLRFPKSFNRSVKKEKKKMKKKKTIMHDRALCGKRTMPEQHGFFKSKKQ